MSMPREALLARTFVELADTLVEDFDVVEMLTLLVHRCVEMLDVAAAGLMLVSPEGDLRMVASSSEQMRASCSRSNRRRDPARNASAPVNPFATKTSLEKTSGGRSSVR